MNFVIEGYLTYLLIILSGCRPLAPVAEEGIASYYADFFQGQLTASGVPYDSARLTAAHRTLPFGTEVRITNLSNDKVVTLMINDRGPFVDKRIIDLSKAAAKELDFITKGITRVQMEVLGIKKE